ncbi:MAG: hypothetical protein ACLS6O_04210 [Bifidobacterium sp.]
MQDCWGGCALSLYEHPLTEGDLNEKPPNGVRSCRRLSSNAAGDYLACLERARFER